MATSLITVTANPPSSRRNLLHIFREITTSFKNLVPLTKSNSNKLQKLRNLHIISYNTELAAPHHALYTVQLQGEV